MAKGKKTGGRQRGQPNAINATVKDMVLAALSSVGGAAYLAEQAASQPVAFLGLVGRVLPLQVTGKDEGPIQAIVNHHYDKA